MKFCYPTCKQKFTGDYFCNNCKNNKNVLDSICFILKPILIPSIIKKKKTILICNECYTFTKNIYFDNYSEFQIKGGYKWIEIYNKNIINFYNKNFNL